MGEKKRKSDHFPFPDHDLALKELSYDPCYSRIPAEDRKPITEKAWARGEAAARETFQQFHGSYDFFAICRESGLTLKEKNIDFVSGNQRYFSDYISGKKEVNLYLKSIALWAEENSLDLKSAENLILSHEYYHFLEWTELGLTSRLYQVPMIQLGKLKLGHTGIRAMSEIGAHAFARTYRDLSAAREKSKTD